MAVVDDDETNRAILARILDRAGFRVHAFDRAEGCLAAVRNGEVDFVFTDFDMPEMNGVELMRAVKEINEDIEVIVMTAGGEVEPAIEATRLGALDYLRKPFTDLGAVAQVANTAASRVTAKRAARAAETAEGGFHFSGSLDETDLYQVLQVIVGMGRDGVLEVEGPPAGQIWIHDDGRLLNARTGRHRGQKALYRLLREGRGGFSLASFADPEDGETLGDRVDVYVFEGVRREDEFRALEQSIPDLDQRWVLAPDSSVSVDELSPLLVEVLAGVIKAPLAREAIEMPKYCDEEILKALEELRKLGAICPAEG